MFEWPRIALVGIAALVATPHAARAQEETREASEEDRALATALFKDARKLIEEGAVAEACRKFEESERLDPGGGTLLNLAICHEREGRTASAWTEFGAALAQARKDRRADRIAIAEKGVASLEARLSKLTITVAAGADRPDLEVTLDGAPVRRPARGLAIPVDPGEHAVEAHATGFVPWHTSVDAPKESGAVAIEVPALALAPPPAPIQPPSTSPANPASTGRARDIATVGSAVLGVAGLALGSVFGLRGLALERDAKAACPNGRCTGDAVSTSERATTSADLSTGAFAIGAAGAGVAALLFFTRPSAPPPLAASVSRSSLSFSWSARF